MIKKMAVFHATDFIKTIEEAEKFPKGYVLAATVECREPEEAFARTNHINSPWYTNEYVNATGISLRSTSVGDVIQKADGGLLFVASFGFYQMQAR